MTLTLKEIAQKIAQNPKLVVVEDYEISVEEREKEVVVFIPNEKRQNKKEKSYFISLRLLHRKRLGEGFTTSPEPDSLGRLVENAISASENTLPCPWFRFPIWRNPTKETGGISVWDPKEVESLGSDVLTIRVSSEKKQKRLQRKTEKLFLEQQWTENTVELSVPIVVEQKEVILKSFIINPASLNEVVLVAKRLQNQKKYFSKATVYSESLGKVVFSEEVSAGILENISSFFMADNLHAENLWNQEGKKISTKVSISDDGNRSVSRGELFDQEGVAGQKVTIIEQGTLVSLLHNTTTGAKYNRPGTGSLRAYDVLRGPRINFARLQMERGEKSLEKMIQEMAEGVFVEAAANWELFERNGALFLSFDAFGWKVENGEGNYPVYCSRLTFPAVKYLETITEVSDVAVTHGNIVSPAVQVEGLYATKSNA